MKISKKNAGLGLRSLAGQWWKKPYLAKALEEAYRHQIRDHSTIKTIGLTDPRIAWKGDVVLQYEKKAGNTSVLEQFLLVSVLKIRKAQTFFEVGTFDGQTAFLLARNIPELQVHTLDLPASEGDKTALPISQGERRYVDKPVIGARFQGTTEASRIHQLLGDSATFDYSPYMKKMDAVFIDGSHDYVYVKNDTEKTLPTLSANGVMLWHDYLTYEEVTRYLEELGKTLPLFHIEGTSLVVHFKD